MDEMTDFQAAVCEAVSEIPAGLPRTYGEVAEMLGRPRNHGQAVSGAVRWLGERDLAPWYRVVPGNGGLIGEWKEEQAESLLAEGADPAMVRLRMSRTR